VTQDSQGPGDLAMNSSARAALQEAHQGALTRHVVEWAGQRGERQEGHKKGIRAARTRVGMAVSPHDFRHSAAVWMAEAGVQMKQIADCLSHEDSRITERVYARFRPACQREAAFGAGGRCVRQEGGVMVGATGIEPVTPRV